MDRTMEYPFDIIKKASTNLQLLCSVCTEMRSPLHIIILKGLVKAIVFPAFVYIF